MPRERRAAEYRAWWTIGTLVAVIVLFTGAGEVWGTLTRQSRTVPVGYAGVTAVDLDIQDGSARVTAGTDDAVTIVQKLDWALRRPVVQQTLDGQTLRIRVRCPQLLGIGVTACDVALDLRVPPATAVTLRMDSGYSRIAGLSGPLDLRATSGELDLDQDSGPIAARLTSGRVSGSGLASPVVQVSTASGEAGLAFAQAPDRLALSCDSGSVTATVPPGSTYRISSHSGSGSPRIDPGLADPRSPRTVTASSGSGSVSLGYTPSS